MWNLYVLNGLSLCSVFVSLDKIRRLFVSAEPNSRNFSTVYIPGLLASNKKQIEIPREAGESPWREPSSPVLWMCPCSVVDVVVPGHVTHPAVLIDGSQTLHGHVPDMAPPKQYLPWSKTRRKHVNKRHLTTSVHHIHEGPTCTAHKPSICV